MFEIGNTVIITGPTTEFPGENYPGFERFMDEFIGCNGKVIDAVLNPYEQNHYMYRVEFPCRPNERFPPKFWFNVGWIRENKVDASSWNELL